MERRILIGCGAVGLTLLLVGAAFVGGWLLGSSDLTAGNQDAITSDSDGEVLARPGVRIEIKPAAGMPDQPVDAGGLLVRQEGSSLFLGTGRLSGVLVRNEARGHSPVGVATRWSRGGGIHHARNTVLPR
jgi:hypothetical protein